MEKKIATTGELARMLKASETTSASMKDLITGVMGLDSGLSHGIASSEAFGREMMGGGTIAGGALSPLWAGALAIADTMDAREAATTATTATTYGKAVTASDMLKEIEKTKAEYVRMTGAGAGDPTGWKMTSVRWLKENHPEYVRVGKNAHNVLTKALAAMSYCEAEAMRRDGAHDPRAAAEMRAQLLDSWDSDRHQNMRDFLLHGGLASRKVALGKDLKDPPGYQYQERSPRKKAPAAVAVEQNLDEVVRELGNSTLGSW